MSENPADVSFRDPGELPWRPAPGFEGKAWEKTLHRDDVNGIFIRLLRCDPGFVGTEILRHDDVEEFAWVLEGAAANTRSGERYEEGMYCQVPMGVEHGPFKSTEGVLMLEVRCRPQAAPTADLGS